MKSFLLGLIVGILVLAIAAVFFMYGRDNKKQVDDANVMVEEVVQEEGEIKVEVMGTPVPIIVQDDGKTMTELQASILTAVSTKKYDELLDDLEDKVFFTHHATECCGDITKAEAILELKYLDNAIPPWLFDKNNKTIKSLVDNYPNKMGDGFVVGISGNDMVVSFKVNSNYMIEEIYIVGDVNSLLL
jgi:hypothetical protein